jgi:hypothetical protein
MRRLLEGSAPTRPRCRRDLGEARAAAEPRIVVSLECPGRAAVGARTDEETAMSYTIKNLETVEDGAGA